MSDSLSDDLSDFCVCWLGAGDKLVAGLLKPRCHRCSATRLGKTPSWKVQRARTSAPCTQACSTLAEPLATDSMVHRPNAGACQPAPIHLTGPNLAPKKADLQEGQGGGGALEAHRRLEGSAGGCRLASTLGQQQGRIPLGLAPLPHGTPLHLDLCLACTYIGSNLLDIFERSGIRPRSQMERPPPCLQTGSLCLTGRGWTSITSSHMYHPSALSPALGDSKPSSGQAGI